MWTSSHKLWLGILPRRTTSNPVKGMAEHQSSVPESVFVSCVSCPGIELAQIVDETSESQISNSHGEDPSQGKSFARRETQVVNVLRCLVFTVFLLTGTFGCYFVYRYKQTLLNRDFELAFKSYADKIVGSFSRNIAKQLDAMDSFSLSVTSYVKDQNLTWPFVVLPDYERRAQKILSQDNGLSLLMAPFVENLDDQAKWIDYSTKNFRMWFDQGLEFQQAGGYASGPRLFKPSHRAAVVKDGYLDIDYSSGIANNIVYLRNDTYVADNDPGLKAPLWQNAPVHEGLHVENSNLLRKEHLASGIRLARAKLASLGTSLNTISPSPTERKGVISLQQHIDLWEYDVGNNEPSGTKTSCDLSMKTNISLLHFSRFSLLSSF